MLQRQHHSEPVQHPTTHSIHSKRFSDTVPYESLCRCSDADDDDSSSIRFEATCERGGGRPTIAGCQEAQQG